MAFYPIPLPPPRNEQEAKEQAGRLRRDIRHTCIMTALVGLAGVLGLLGVMAMILFNRFY